MSNNSAAKIRTTKVHPFFSCNIDKQALFSINPNIEIDDAISQASCFLSSALKITEDLAVDNGSAQAWAAYYLIEISKAIIDSAIYSSEFGENHGI